MCQFQELLPDSCFLIQQILLNEVFESPSTQNLDLSYVMNYDKDVYPELLTRIIVCL